MPHLGGAYGGYIGMTGTWAYWLGCSGQEHFLAYSATNAAQARTNFTKYHLGVGYGAYWFMGGPGVDPHYNGTVAEATSWGAQQAVRTLADVGDGGGINYRVIWADIELPGISPAPDNGWNSVYTSSCSGKVKQGFVASSLDRADFNGYASYITAHSSYKVGVYSSPSVWSSIFGTAAPPPSRTPMSGLTNRKPRASAAPRSAGASTTGRAAARSSSAARPAPASTR
jgi:hypothetical protein